MKKQLLFAGSIVLLMSCGANNSQPPAQSQAQIDSTVNAKLAEHDAEAAKKKEAEHKEHEHTARKEEGNNSTPAASPATAAQPAQTPTTTATQGGLRGHSDQTQSNTNTTTAQPQGGGLRGRSDQSQGGH